jgi:alpha-tubulin suppressor-like RCC1 family protein
MKLLRQRAAALALLLLEALGLGLPAHGAGPVLSISRDGSNVMLNFAGQLQSASRVEGPYTNVLGATSPYLCPVSAVSQQFCRSTLGVGGTFSAGAQYTVALKTDGSLWSWGWNDSGQLGAPGPGDWISAACGYAHTLALKADGTLWAWGSNEHGQLGIGRYDLERHYQPAQVGTNADWAGAACGAFHTIALKTDRTLWAWGWGAYGQLGNGTYGRINQPVRIGPEMDWIRVAAGAGHTTALKTDGSLWAWGGNFYGELGNGTYGLTNQPVQVGVDMDWQAVACGGFFPAIEPGGVVGYTVALKTDGSLWAWGDNTYGEYGNGTFESTNQPVKVGPERDWMRIACGSTHTVALKGDGTLWAWGANGSGQLGNGTFERTNQPVRVGSDTDWIRVTCGSSHTVALKTNGTLWAWGDRLGGGTAVNTNQPVQIGADTDWAR